MDTDIFLALAFLSSGVPIEEDRLVLDVSPVAVEDEPNSLPSEYSLSENYPNPFNQGTTISYSLALSGDVTLIIYNLSCGEVALLVDGFQQEGEYQVQWNASNLSSEIYFYRLYAADFTETKKMMLLK